MSGGSWDYFYQELQSKSERLSRSDCPYRKALGAHFMLLAEAMHDIEWVDSYDYAPGKEIEAIKTALGERFKPLVLEQIKAETNRLIEQLQKLRSEL